VMFASALKHGGGGIGHECSAGKAARNRINAVIRSAGHTSSLVIVGDEKLSVKVGE